MIDKASELLEAQVQFTLKSYRGKRLEKKIADNIDAIFEDLNEITANDVVDQEDIVESMRIILCPPVKEELLDMISTILLGALDLDILRKTQIKDLISKKSYKLLVDKIVQSDTVREKAIGKTMDSRVYAELISDVLYHGIKEYLLDENFLVKMRGVSTLLKASKWSINKSMPNLDGAVETTTKAYIQANIERFINLSKTFLENEFDEERIRSIADEMWKALRKRKLGSFSGSLNEEVLDEYISISEQIWDDIRQSEFYIEMCSQVAEFWLATYGDQPIIQLLDSIGIGKDGLSSQIQTYVPAIVKKAEKSGYLEKRIRAQLAPFYGSKEVLRILNG